MIDRPNPNPFACNAEAEIRKAVVERIRDLLPTPRVIHELNVEQGTVRADIAAVTTDRLYLFEIKSSRDTLGRLPTQIRHFHPCCHGLIVVADEKWCGRATEAGYPNCDVRKVIAHNGPATLWQWPEPVGTFDRLWRLPATTPPWPAKMLTLLWASELLAVAAAHRVAHSPRTPAYRLLPELCASLTGQAITRAVCAALRARSFAWADPAIEPQEQAA